MAVTAGDTQATGELRPEQVRQLLRECVTVVKPGDVLVLRCPEGWTPQQAGEMQRYADYWLDGNAPDVKVMVVPYLDMAVIEGARPCGPGCENCDCAKDGSS